MLAAYLLDTNAFLWAVREPRKLSGAARQVISEPDNALVVPALVAWELTTKFRIGKLPEAEPVISGYLQVVSRLRAQPLSHTTGHMLLAGSLVWGHRDPFDRLLAATSILEGLPIISADAIFDQLSDIKRVW